MRYLFVVFVALILCADVCFGDQASLQKAWGCYLSGDYRGAVDSCRVVADNKALGEEGHYIMGLAFLNLGDSEQARENFSFVMENYPKSDIKDKLLLGIGDSYYLQQEFDKAQQYYIQLLNNFPETDYASMAYLRLGISQRKLGKWQSSESSFNNIINGFPSSLEVAEAESFLREKASFFSVQVGAFSKRSNAQKLCSLLGNKGYDSYIDKGYNKDKLMYRVRVGKHSDKESSQNEAVKLKKEGFNVRICT